MLLILLAHIVLICVSAADKTKPRVKVQLSERPAYVQNLIDLAENSLPAFDYESRANQLLSIMKHSPPSSSSLPRKGTLCSTFIKWSDATSQNLLYNMQYSVGFCNWLVIVYNSTGVSAEHIRMSIELSLDDHRHVNRSINTAPWLTVVTLPPKDTLQIFLHDVCEQYWKRHLDPFLIKFHQCELISNLPDLPFNPHLYAKESQLIVLLPHLFHYEYVWTLDGDLGFHTLNVTRFHRIHMCAFHTPPLVSQPLIQQSTQFYRYLLRRSWGHTNTLASTVGFVELQASYFHTHYLEWFILAFIVPLANPMYILGSDWGVDEMYCTAARQYKAIMVSHNATTTDPLCAVIVGNMGIHHNNLKTIKKVMGGRDTHLHLNYALMHIVHKMFGGYCSGGLRVENDPFQPDASYVQSYKFREDCPL
ncbi:hypothetical protein EON65_21895 [archaeon]|nr:MAG: hypothetical protein EON65_21895 [archaeon]